MGGTTQSEANPPNYAWARLRARETNHYLRDPIVISCPKEKLLRSLRTFRTLPYPQISSLHAKRRPPLSAPFLFSIKPSS
ncbi:hypothetical protein IEQ34_007087 [Dendrobium chrysotoxum]|uniref:Uncharacterized protein n=1 Tax=Dendrobium chrysotoxum TaxID=161865 RepID=A0AAV7H6U9_DENCH|nr:hypothetical protein IEQ34_007087 [Dendrobium chrysotoxum]